MEKYEIISTLGVGSFGTVYKAKEKNTSNVVAIKKFNKKYYSLDKCKELREVKSLLKLKHDNIIRLFDMVLEKDNTLYLIFELMEQNLYEMLNNSLHKNKMNQGIEENKIKSMIYQVLQGLTYMHKFGYFHRDLKPENILVDESLNIKLADFGLAREIRSVPPYTQYVSTRWYRAPECLLESTHYSFPIDIWALGCITFELFTGKALFPGNNQRDTLMKITSLLGPPNKGSECDILAKKIDHKFPNISTNAKQDIRDMLPSNISNHSIDFILSMLKWDASQRPTASNLLQHKFFSDLYDKEDINKYFINIEKDTEKDEKPPQQAFDIDKLLNNSLEMNKCKLLCYS